MQTFQVFPILAIAPLTLVFSPVNPSFVPATAQPSVSTAAGSAQLVRSQPLQLAQQSRVRRIRFAPGAISATIEDAVVRGTRDTYLVGASKGQTMTVAIASLENNAVFELKAPPNKAGQRRTLKPEAISWTGVLPQSGDYQVIVGGTRGNASYKLQVTIK
ncbi:MAG: hypothetical protein IGS48_08470 [Oscillatoriales cyanobacterium C42_A2020_001]|nr:hypothetical protein [Leptolyngbyaceae cyanobacterium C42_A2020_001]